MKTILFVVKAIVSGSVVALCCCFLFWLGMYIDFSFISFFGWAVLASMIFGALTVFCENMYHSCEAYNKKNNTKNVNQTSEK